MEYTLKQIRENQFEKGRTRDRRLSEIFIPFNYLGKKISPYLTYIFLNMGLHPDHITMLSFFFIFLGAYFFTIGQAIYGAFSFLTFMLLDSVDGDMARVKGPSSYGGMFDSFGADIFYALAPISVGFFLSEANIEFIFYSQFDVTLIGAFVSASFLVYRLINFKLTIFLNKRTEAQKNEQERKKSYQPFPVKMIKLYKHILIKGNFFSEPGMVTWIFLFTILKKYEFLAVYLFLVLLYNLGVLFIDFINTYKSFRFHDKK